MAKSTRKTPDLKSSAITVRLDPKLRYALELLSRKQYRTISSVVEWAINQAIQSPEGVANINELWDVDEVDRLIKLAESKPELLNYDEQRIWKVISDHGDYWNWNSFGSDEPEINNHLIKRDWEKIQKVANGDLDKSALKIDPTKLGFGKAPLPPGALPISDEEIPF